MSNESHRCSMCGKPMQLVAAGWYCFKDDFLIDSETLETERENSKMLAEEEKQQSSKSFMNRPTKGSERTVVTNIEELTKFCRYCGTRISQDSTYCEKCGAKLIRVEAPETQLCSACHSVLPRGAQFCDECGSPADRT